MHTIAEEQAFAKVKDAGVSLTDIAAPDISVFLPVLNEEPNLGPLHDKLDRALAQLGRSAEIIYVDDGSTDGSLAVLREIAARDSRVRVIALRRNYGQTPAMAAGIDAARGEVLIPMDADLQNDPADIVRLLEKIDEGYDVVSGWRKNRQDKLFTPQDTFDARESNNFLDWRRAVARLWMLVEGLPARLACRCSSLWRDASLHSHLRFVVWRPGH
jgi:glycosyltransferase involved in cell wall biosynthesis